MKSTGKSIVVLFGSQTGTGEEFAQRLAKNSRLYGLKTLVVDPEEIDVVSIVFYFKRLKLYFVLFNWFNRMTWKNYTNYQIRLSFS